ncbi:S8 family peptidase [Aquimarina agarivorans]|uniref:S8 family peptidase n=1 Tax=Aquimarina agarivorans TaxID=980584 RepID=UPI000248E6AB|nr:S8 family peptidase [Aquimarina agarivorans]
MKKIFLFGCILLGEIVAAQSELAWVFFNEKPDAESRINTPEKFLTLKAIERKRRHKIKVDDRDLPLEQEYITKIKNQSGITFLASSKWFNGIFVEGKKSDIETLLSLSFVKSLFFMDRSLNPKDVKNEIPKFKYRMGLGEPTKIDVEKNKSTETFDYGFSEDQNKQINVQALHNEGFTGKGITIAIMDSDFTEFNNDILTQRMRGKGLFLGGYDFNKRSDNFINKIDEIDFIHGIGVLSVMAGFFDGKFTSSGNELKYVGTAPDASYYNFVTEVMESESPKEEIFWIAAAERADSLGVDIINTSLGYDQFDEEKYNYKKTDMDGKTSFIARGASLALEKGMLTVVSAGNLGQDPWKIISTPADSPNVLSVAGVEADNKRWRYSSIGPSADGRQKPDVAALSQSVLGTAIGFDLTGGDLLEYDGTSFAAPLISGAIACLWQSIPEKTPSEIMDIVRKASSQANTPDNELGFGIPDFGKAAGLIDDTLFITDFDTVDTTNDDMVQIMYSSTDNSIIINGDNNQMTYTIFDLSGGVITQDKLDKNKAENKINHLSKGFYFLHVEDLASKKSTTLKFTK